MARSASDCRAGAAETRRRLAAFAVLAPACAVILILVLWPATYVTWLSFFEIRLVDIARGIQGPATWANYASVLTDAVFHNTVFVTLFYVAASTCIAFLVGLVAALALNGTFRGSKTLRTLVLSPWAVAPVIASLVWMFLLDRQFGLLNYLLIGAGLIEAPVGWLDTPLGALTSIVLVSVWKSFPFFAIMLLAGLQTVPPVLYEAARLDGAGPWARFRDVTWPGLKPTAAITLLFSALTSFREVETILVLTKGGPARSTETLAVQAYVEAFHYYDVGESAALGALGLVTVLVAVALLAHLARRRIA